MKAHRTPNAATFEALSAARRTELVDAMTVGRVQRANIIRPERGRGRKDRPRQRRWTAEG